VYLNNYPTLDEFKQCIHETITSVEVSERKVFLNNIFKMF
jgi:hypothetical protein